MKTFGKRGPVSHSDDMDGDDAFSDADRRPDHAVDDAEEEDHSRARVAASEWDDLEPEDDEDDSAEESRDDWGSATSKTGQRSGLVKAVPWFAGGLLLAAGVVYYVSSGGAPATDSALPSAPVVAAAPGEVTEGGAVSASGEPFVSPVVPVETPPLSGGPATSQESPVSTLVGEAPAITPDNAGIASRPVDITAAGVNLSPASPTSSVPAVPDSSALSRGGAAPAVSDMAGTAPAVETGAVSMTPPLPAENMASTGGAPSSQVDTASGVESAPPARDATAEPVSVSALPVAPPSTPSPSPIVSSVTAPPAVTTAAAPPAASPPPDTQQMGDLSSRLDVLEHRMDDLTKAIDKVAQAVAAPAKPVAAAPAALPPEVATQLKALQADVGRLQSRLAEVNTRSASVAAPAPSANTESSSANSAKRAPSVSPPSSPARAERPSARPPAVPAAAPVASRTTWVLRAAQNGEAWISRTGSDELQHVTVGQNVPGLGRVTSVRQDAGRWVVSGTQGSVRQ